MTDGRHPGLRLACRFERLDVARHGPKERVGFDRTRLKVVADPALRFNTHSITIKGRTGIIDLLTAYDQSPRIRNLHSGVGKTNRHGCGQSVSS